MEAFSVKALFFAKRGILSRFFNRNKWGEVKFYPEGIFTMSGDKKEYGAKDIYRFHYHFSDENVLDHMLVEMEDDPDGVCRFAVYGEDIYKLYAWCIRQDVFAFGEGMLRVEQPEIRQLIEEAILEQLSVLQYEEESTEEIPEDDLKWEMVDADFRRWICAACAINRLANGWDINEFGGASPDDPLGRELGRQILRGSWEIESRGELIETIQDMAGQKILWQLLRTLQNAGFGYLAGFLTLREALNVALATGQRLQIVTRSWDGLGRAYLRSYRDYLGSGDDYKLRADAFLELQTNENSIYNDVPFDLELKRSW
ncbi:DUF1266 domain-containing protein [Selenomonas ruminantium]|uniref:DUF1266 domain-containing protein n=1 Tax=Selenomonas ruminantium TaxID=971 RepID=A0A1H0NNN5_SELRU|nr:DUF1266 domain-containing protein [Selenomonas ruminantium]SDO94324.1 Protein of unknown function [Selenomonas ruminantium]